MSLNFDDPRAPYLQVADDLRKAITHGSLNPGDKLPAARELASRYGVANMTIQSALRVLRTEGLIYSIPGRGSFVRQPPNQVGPVTEDAASRQEFERLARQLEAMSDELRHLSDRVNQLERGKPSSRRRSPAR